MKLVIEPKDFPDYIACFLLSCILEMENEDFIPTADNEEWFKIVERLKTKGMKTFLLKYFLSLDAQTKTIYKYFKKVFIPVHTSAEIFHVQQNWADDLHMLNKNPRDKFTGKKTKKTKKEKKTNDLITKVVKNTMRLITQKDDVNPKKLEMLTEKVYNLLKDNGDI